MIHQPKHPVSDDSSQHIGQDIIDLKITSAGNELESLHSQAGHKNGVADDPLGFFMMDDRRQLTEDLLQARLILEPALAALAAQNGSEEEIKELEYILKELEGLIRDKKDYSEKDSQFHAQIATCSHNRVMTNLIPVITEGVRVFADSVEETEYEQTLLSHRRIFEAIRDGRGEDARQEMYFHLMYNHNRYRKE